MRDTSSPCGTAAARNVLLPQNCHLDRRRRSLPPERRDRSISLPLRQHVRSNDVRADGSIYVSRLRRSYEMVHRFLGLRPRLLCDGPSALKTDEPLLKMVCSKSERRRYFTAAIAALNSLSKSNPSPASFAAFSTAFCATGRGYPRFTRALNTSSATAPSERGAEASGANPTMSSSLSFSSSTTRSAVFLPMPGIFVSVAWS